MSPDHSRAVVLRRTAWICALLVLCIVGISAAIRLSSAGLSCMPWPACYGQTIASTPTLGVEFLRVLHRVAAVVVLPLLLMLVMAGFSRKPQIWSQRWVAVMAVVVAVFLAVLGRWTPGAKVPAVVLGNLLGGFVLLALCVRMALTGQASWQASALAPSARRWGLIALALLLLQVVLGGLLSASLSGLSCPTLTACALPDPVPWQALNPWHIPRLDAANWPVHPEGVLLHLLHRSMALLAVLAIIITAVLLRRSGWQRTSAALFALLVLQLLLGILLVLQGLPLMAAVAHNITAALLLALLFALP